MSSQQQQMASKEEKKGSLFYKIQKFKHSDTINLSAAGFQLLSLVTKYAHHVVMDAFFHANNFRNKI